MIFLLSRDTLHWLRQAFVELTDVTLVSEDTYWKLDFINWGIGDDDQNDHDDHNDHNDQNDHDDNDDYEYHEAHHYALVRAGGHWRHTCILAL